jgi:glutamyl-Q tRNA(Asp) synthetase
LIAAVASFLEARTQGGQWLVRVEDIDPPREQSGATKQILDALEVYGFEWDGPVTYQSTSRRSHDEAIETLVQRGLAYPCGCSRRELAHKPHGSLGAIYPGTCRTGCDKSVVAIRIRTDDDVVAFEDRLQGLQSQRLESESGDFVILRKDGLIAYQLAVVVDDNLQAVTDIVRGIDLMDSTPRQLWLQRLLDYPTPNYAHIPVATNEKNQKLSKSHGAGAISLERTAETLIAALRVLGQQPANDLDGASPADIWSWAQTNWNIDVLTQISEIPVGHLPLAKSAK